MEYWAEMSAGYADLNLNPRPSATVANQIMGELQKDPEKIVEYLHVFQGVEKIYFNTRAHPLSAPFSAAARI